MRYVIPFVLAAFMSLSLVGGEEVEAASRCNCPKCQQVRRQKQPSMFKKLADLERRKNAWLRKTFLGK